MGGPEAIEILWDAVVHPEYLVSCNAVRYLGWIGTAKDRDRLEALAQEVHSTILRLTPAQQEAVRAMAARAAEAIAVRAVDRRHRLLVGRPAGGEAPVINRSRAG